MGRSIPSSLELLILHLLSKKPLHGYALMKEVEEITGTRPSPGTVYPLLREMVRRGLLEVRITGTGKKVVKTYYLTEEGRRMLDSYSGQVERLVRFLEGVRTVKASGLAKAVNALLRLIALVPSLDSKGRRRVEEFLSKVAMEAESLVKELEGGSSGAGGEG